MIWIISNGQFWNVVTAIWIRTIEGEGATGMEQELELWKLNTIRHFAYKSPTLMTHAS